MTQTVYLAANGLLLEEQPDLSQLLLVTPDLAPGGQRQGRIYIKKRLVIALDIPALHLDVDRHFFEGALRGAQLKFRDPGDDLVRAGF